VDFKAIYDTLLARFGGEVILSCTEVSEGVRDPFIVVAGAKIEEVCRCCRDEAELRFDFCQSITALDAPETLTCVYHLYSYAHRHTLALKATTPRANPHLPSCVAVWACADWYEREAYDLYGVVFDGHPDLRRLLLPDDWAGHPMRKDWKEGPTYNGIPTTRDNTLELLESEP
jgi:NADH-quinone oxidoreductase subunit C